MSDITVYPPPVDYSKAMAYESDANKETALAQINSSAYSMQQATMDQEMQNAANLELGIEGLDTTLQTAGLDYVQQMTAEEDRHAEALAGAGSQLQQLESTSSLSSDLPPPDSSSDPSMSPSEDPSTDPSTDGSSYGF